LDRAAVGAEKRDAQRDPGRGGLNRGSTYDGAMPEPEPEPEPGREREPELQLVRADHAPALLAFEQENRAYFAASVSDRGDAYFTDFAERHRELLAWQAEGTNLFHVLVEPDGAIVGRINVFEVADGAADLGYRIAERAAGRGLATAGVRKVCALAAAEYGLSLLRAAAAVAKRFVPTGELDLHGRPGISYRRELT
jgi:ribosomal-protein-alanine N-acetyltransferase